MKRRADSGNEMNRKKAPLSAKIKTFNIPKGLKTLTKGLMKEHIMCKLKQVIQHPGGPSVSQGYPKV